MPGTLGSEQAIAARAERDAVVARSSDLVMYFEPDGRIAWASPAAGAVFGLDPEALAGRNGLDMIHPDDQAGVIADFMALTGLGDHVRVEFRVITDDGVVHWFEETATNLVDDPHVGYVVGNLREITERKRSEDAIALQSRILEAAGQAIVVMDMDGQITYWNPAATGIYGWEASEAVGRSAAEILRPAAGWDAQVRALVACIAVGETWSGDLLACRKDGSEIAVFATNTPVYSDTGTRIGMIGISSDITQRKQHELDQGRLSAIVGSSADGIFSADLDGTVLSWNHAAEELYGYSADEMIGSNAWITVPPELVDGMRNQAVDVGGGRSVTGLETIRRRADGTDVHVSVSISPIRDAGGTVVAESAIIRDITQRVELQDRLEVDRSRLANAQRIAHLGSFEIDFSTDTVSWSAELHAILGLSEDTQPSPEAFRSCVHPDDRALFERKLADALQGHTVECTHRIVRPNGDLRWVTVRTESRGDPSSPRVSGTLLDITDRKLLELDLAHQASHDGLTGLPNRGLLVEQLDAALVACEPDGGEVGLLLLAVDRFKLINDSRGHECGDQLLIAIAGSLRASLDRGEIVARFGGDTFAIVMPALASADQMLDLVDRIRSELANGLDAGIERYTPTVSVGMVIAATGDLATTVLRDADTAMYRAKERGRDRAEWFDPSLHHEIVASFEVERELRHAIGDEQLFLVFQPVLDLQTGEVSSCEALVRWQPPDRGVVGPDEFIPVAESSGLIVPLGAWVLRKALATVRAWPGTVNVAVNISPRQLAEPDLFALVRDSLVELGVSPSRLTLEVTETAVVQDPTAAARTIAALRGIGVGVVIDDFGTGYTSLSFLRDYELDGLKIDRSFISDLGHGSTAIVDAIIRMSGALGLRVIAEGIETEDQLDKLRSLGCQYVQGYLVSRPVPSAELPFMQLRRHGAEVAG